MRYDTGAQVRIVNLPPRQRVRTGPDAPKVGDIATIRHVVSDSQHRTNGYIVECFKPDGTLAWMGDVLDEEIEPAQG